jgi:hypothetical protein
MSPPDLTPDMRAGFRIAPEAKVSVSAGEFKASIHLMSSNLYIKDKKKSKLDSNDLVKLWVRKYVRRRGMRPLIN